MNKVNLQLNELNANQTWSLVTTFVLGTSLMIPLAVVAERDSWISTLIGMILGSLIWFIYNGIMKLAGETNVLKACQKTLGYGFTLLIGLVFLWHSFLIGSLVFRDISDLTASVILPETPAIAILLLFAIIVIWVNHQGLTILGRCSQVIVILPFFSILLSSILLLRDMDFRMILPIFNSGPKVIVEASVQTMMFPFTETVIILFLYSNFCKEPKVKRNVLLGILTGGVLLTIANLRNLFVFGPLNKELTYPSYASFGYIEVADFIERIEPLVFMVWMGCIFIKLSVCVFVTAQLLTQILHLRSYKVYLIPICLLMIVFSFFVHKNQAELLFFANNIWPFYSFPIQVLLPLFIFLVLWMKNRNEGTIG